MPVVVIDKELHKTIKKIAADMEITLKELTEKALREYIEKIKSEGR